MRGINRHGTSVESDTPFLSPDRYALESAGLTECERVVLYCHHDLHMSYRSIGRAIRRDDKTMAAIVHRAEQKIRNAFSTPPNSAPDTPPEPPVG